MAAIFAFAVIGFAKTKNSFSGLPRKVKAKNVEAMERIVNLLVGTAQANIKGTRDSNPAKTLGRKSGLLASRIGGQVQSSGGSVIGTIGPQRLVYGRIQELGGTIFPRKGKFLVFTGRDGNLIFTESVRIPARPYLAPALKKREPDIKEALGDAFVGALDA